MNISNKRIYYILLDSTGAKHIRDPLWNTIELDAPLIPLLKSVPMQRLTRIHQLGPTSLVYPGTTHTRFAHSIGVFYISKLILLHLLKDPQCPVISYTQAYSFLAAALLHDLGHFPYTHSLKELPLPNHEELSAQIIVEQLSSIMKQHNISPELTAAIISPQAHSVGNEDALALDIFSQLLSGPLDPDKLDYLCRDAFFAGVPYGIQDVSYAIKQLIFTEDHSISFISMLPVENILFSKYLMYSSVYWHKTVRGATAMIKYSLYRALLFQSIQPDNLIALDDNEFVALCNTVDSSYMKPAQMVSQGTVFHLGFESDFNDRYDLLIDLERRRNLEEMLSQKLSIEFVIIDVPEKISFEVNNEGKGVFSQPIIDSFVNNIRKLRIFFSSNDLLTQEQELIIKTTLAEH